MGLVRTQKRGRTLIFKNKRLSILICSIVGRETLLRRLLASLDSQTSDDVEILVETDDRKITTGAKRNVLLKRAAGDYVAFVDDDDTVSDDYVPKILSALTSSPDCCSLEGSIHFKRRNETKKFVHSISYDDWFEKDGIYYRCPNHLNTVKREIALQVMFPDVRVGEDKRYSLALRPLLDVEECIGGVIYYYWTN